MSDTTKMQKSACYSFTPIVMALAQRSPHVNTSAEPENGYKQKHTDSLLANTDALLAKINLHLSPRGGLKTDRRKLLPPHCCAFARNVPLNSP